MPSVSNVNPDASALLVQLSDSHLFAEADTALLGMNTRASLQRVIELVREQQPRIDLVLATGDLSQDGTLESYQQFRDMTRPIGAPARWIPGNHDEPQVMAQAAVHSDLLEPVVDIGNWRITLLDSAVPGSVPGYLQDQQLQLLAQALSEAPNRHHLVCLHHHPVSIGCAWMEPIGLRNPEALFAVLERFPQVKALLWGTCIRKLTASATACGCWPHRPPASSLHRAVRTSRSASKRRGIAGCACMPTGGWRRG